MVLNLSSDFVRYLHRLRFVTQILPFQSNKIYDSVISSKISFKAEHDILAIIEFAQIYTKWFMLKYHLWYIADGSKTQRTTIIKINI